MKKCFCCCFKLRWYFQKTAIALSPSKRSGITRTKKYLTTQFHWVGTSLESFFEVFLNLYSKLCVHAQAGSLPFEPAGKPKTPQLFGLKKYFHMKNWDPQMSHN